MGNEGQLYTPVVEGADGRLVVELGDTHPGSADPEYRERRNQIAELAARWSPGDPLPTARYTDQEHDVWAIAADALAPLHRELACTAFLEGKAALELPEDHIPQLSEVSDALHQQAGFGYAPAAGLVPLRHFYGSLADDVFHSTQYIRHHSVPLYTPEPDVIHEVVGHGNSLASPRFVALYRSAGEAARRVETDEALEFISSVFWFSLEFGVVDEKGEPRAYGAGLLSSYGEIQAFRDAQLMPLDIRDMGTRRYDISHYQPVLFEARSFTEVEDVVGGFFDTVDDTVVERLRVGIAS